MAFASIKKQEADAAHENEYKNKEFIIAQFQRSGFFNFFPYSMVYGLSDIGAWYGLISTDGEKVIITRSTVSDMAKIKKKWTFQKSEIHKTTDGTFSFRIVFDKKKTWFDNEWNGRADEVSTYLSWYFSFVCCWRSWW